MGHFRTAMCSWAIGLMLTSFGNAQPPMAQAQLTFTTVDVPGAGFTGIEGINTAGQMVGYYGQTNSGPFHSFIVNGGAFTFFDYPGASTLATGINDSGLVVGYRGDLKVKGFLYDGTTFTDLRDGIDSATFSIGINNAGDVVGGAGNIDSTNGFEWFGGKFKKVAPPGSYVYVYVTGINNFGQVVGWTNSGGDAQGFTSRAGRTKTIAFPSALQTEALAINDSGIIVGWYQVGGSFMGFALLNGAYVSYGYPAAMGTFPRGINASGQIVGEYTLDFQTYHGFVSSPITASQF